MAYQAAYEALKACGLENRVRLFDVSSATVELAAAAVGCIPAMIAMGRKGGSTVAAAILVIGGGRKSVAAIYNRQQ